jgi:hypothetical protein
MTGGEISFILKDYKTSIPSLLKAGGRGPSEERNPYETAITP